MRTDRDGYAHAGEAMLHTGTTAYQPTFITASEDDLVAAVRAIPVELPGPTIIGAHLEARSSRRAGSASTRGRAGALPTRRCSGGCSTPGR